jgi:hypothetical protein
MSVDTIFNNALISKNNNYYYTDGTNGGYRVHGHNIINIDECIDINNLI